MDPTTAITWFVLGVLTKRRYDMLRNRFGDLDRALSALNGTLLQEIGCKPETVEQTLRFRCKLQIAGEDEPATLRPFGRAQISGQACDLQQYTMRMREQGIHLVSWEDDAYPALLREIGDPPVFLSYRGDLSLLQYPCLGIVGTRAMSGYGKRVVEAFVPKIVASGVITVSGLAFGIDSAVARQTLACGGKTVAVLGHGLGSIYPPTNADLSKQIVAAGGLLLSEFPLDIAPTKYTFPSRNRIIAGLCKGVLVIEAGEKSGALITADLALDYGRDAYAVPGSIFSEGSAGCHAVITRGEAKLVTSAEEILCDIGVRVLGRSQYVPQNVQEERLLDALSGGPMSVSELGEKLLMNPGVICATLTTLELAGVAGNTMEGWIRR